MKVADSWVSFDGRGLTDHGRHLHSGLHERERDGRDSGLGRVRVEVGGVRLEV